MNLETKIECDIDATLKISGIKCILYHLERSEFLVVANRKDDNLGFYLLTIDENTPTKYKMITSWENGLNIDNVNMYFSKGINKIGETFKELIIGYKAIYINTYNTVVQDMSDDNNAIICRHEAFQLWESETMGLLL